VTWIIGSATLFGSAILVSDICVTFTYKDGAKRRDDCLQKIYPLGRFVIGGFAGSVSIGFDTLEKLQREFANGPPDAALDVNMAAHTWLSRVIRRAFRDAPECEQRQGSSIILASAHPTKNRGDAPWPQTDIHIFKSPNFDPVVADPLEMVAIGSGNDAAAHMDAIRELRTDTGFLKAAVIDNKTGQASLLAHLVGTTLKNNPIQGVSTMFQVGVVRRGEYTIHDHEYTVHEQNGRKINYTFPPIARCRKEFETLIRERYCGAETAKC